MFERKFEELADMGNCVNFLRNIGFSAMEAKRFSIVGEHWDVIVTNN